MIRFRLWNELTNLILRFLYDKQTKNRVDFDFYDKFVKSFQWNLDNIKLLKIVRMCIHNLSSTEFATQRRSSWSSWRGSRREATFPNRPNSS